MLTGPAGVGKTMFAKYLAKVSGAKFYVFSPSSEDNTGLENATKLKRLFEEAKNHTPSIIFVDEILYNGSIYTGLFTSGLSGLALPICSF